MKATKFIALIAFAGFGLFAEGAFAQGNDQTEQAAPPVTEESTGTGEETQPYNETVTIDSSGVAPEGTPAEGGSDQVERKEKLRVYSGKHDGNNVIVDPR